MQKHDCDAANAYLRELVAGMLPEVGPRPLLRRYPPPRYLGLCGPLLTPAPPALPAPDDAVAASQRRGPGKDIHEPRLDHRHFLGPVLGCRQGICCQAACSHGRVLCRDLPGLAFLLRILSIQAFLTPCPPGDPGQVRCLELRVGLPRLLMHALQGDVQPLEDQLALYRGLLTATAASGTSANGSSSAGLAAEEGSTAAVEVCQHGQPSLHDWLSRKVSCCIV